MRTWRILLIALQLVLLIPSFGMSQEMNECTTAIIDSIVDAKVQQVLADNIEQSIEAAASKTYKQHDNEMKDWYTGLGILVTIICVCVTVAGTFNPYLLNKRFEKRFDKKSREINDYISKLKEEIKRTNNQTQAMVLYMLAREKNNPGEKIELCKKVLEYYPSYYLGHKLLGVSYFRIKDLDKAIKSYSLTLDIDIDDTIYLARALAYSEDGQDDKAIADYNSATTINPHNDNAHYNKAFKLYRMGKYKDAHDSILEAIKLKEADKYYELSCLINERLGDNKAALEDAEKGLEIVTQEKKTRLDFFKKKINELKGEHS